MTAFTTYLLSAIAVMQGIGLTTLALPQSESRSQLVDVTASGILAIRQDAEICLGKPSALFQQFHEN